MIYMDNAATSWPKPPEVLKAMVEELEKAGGNPGRSGHRLSIAAARVINDTREEIAGLFNIYNPLRVIFTLNATHAINYVLSGFLKKGDRVVAGSLEHNAVMRPLRAQEKKGAIVTIVQNHTDGTYNLEEFAAAISNKVKLVIINHASNVTGTIAPLAELTSIAHAKGAFTLVDAAQTAGTLPIDMKKMGIDFLAFTGHKGLMGPSGTGGLVISDNIDVSRLEPLFRGGTGSNSKSEDQPDDLPDKFESGTLNLPGIAGLGAGIKLLNKTGIEAVRSSEMEMMDRLYTGLSAIRGVTIYGNPDPRLSISVVSFTIKNQTVSEIGRRLDEEYGVLTRVGLHCAPSAHRTLGTFPAGTVRIAPGFYTKIKDIDDTLAAIRAIVVS